MEKNERNYGIDALRILSMLMVVGLHLMGQGGVLHGNTEGTGNYYAIWYIEIMFHVAVNCYALISGYVGIRSKFKLTNIVMLWLQVAFYSFIISLLFYVFKPGSVTAEQLFRSLLPLTSPRKLYWYFSSYTVMFFFIPAYNAMINNLSKRQAGASVGAILLLTGVVYPLFKAGFFGTPPTDVFGLANGYSPLWLSVLYLVGAYFSKHKLLHSIPRSILALIYFASITLTFITYLFGKSGGAAVSYIFPTIVISSIALLLLFANLKLGWAKRIISFFTPMTFGVYLIHENPLVKEVFILDKTKPLTDNSPLTSIPILLGSILTVYLVCSLIDYLRLLLFKVLRIKERIYGFEESLLSERGKTDSETREIK